MDQKVKQPNIFKRAFAKRGMGQVITVFFGLIVLCLVFNIVNPNFLGERNIPNLFRQFAPFLIVGIGQSFVLITGNIDLSIGSVLGLSLIHIFFPQRPPCFSYFPEFHKDFSRQRPRGGA